MSNRQIEIRKHEVRVGLTMVIGIAIIVFVILAVGNQHGILGNRYHLNIEMSRVNGLQAGAPVRLNGVYVGSVTDVHFSEELTDQKVQIKLEIFTSVKERIRKDSKAHIGTLGLLGDKYVAITMGTPSEPILKDGDQLSGADPLDIEVLIDEGVDILSSVKTSVNNLNYLTEKLKRGEGTLGLLLNETNLYYTVDTLLTDLLYLSQSLKGNNTTLSQMLNDSTFYPALKKIVVNGQVLTDSLVNGDSMLNQLLNDPEFYDKLTCSVDYMHNILENIDKGKGSIGQAVRNKKLYENLNTTTVSLDSLLKDIKENPKRYIHVEVF
ncbi:MAG: MlaD family protein [candidate division KSB1 bacterium]|nr:MlaD family protein [candidate division KSB1 bacterium]